MADGTKAGLLTSKEIKEINALKRAREKNSTFSGLLFIVITTFSINYYYYYNNLL
jgi:hypothetical protein